MTGFEGRRVVVTGGASGIGRACAEAFAARGASVVVADVDADAATATAEAIGGEAWAVDLGDTAALADLSLDADILVNNAGIQHVRPIEDFEPERFSLILRIMLEAPFLLIRAALPGMYARGFGRIINVSSVHGLLASPFKSAYVAAKHGLEGLSKVTALEGGAARGHVELRQPRLRAHAARREAARRPGAGARHPRGGGALAGHAHRVGREAARGARRRWRASRSGSPARRPEWSPAPATPWTADGARGESGARSARPTRRDRRVGLRRR